MNYLKENKALIILFIFSLLIYANFDSSISSIEKTGSVSLKNLSIRAPKSSVYFDNMNYESSITKIYSKVSPDKLSFYQKSLVALNSYSINIYCLYFLPFLWLLYFYYNFNGTLFNKRAEPVLFLLAISAFGIFNFYLSFIDTEINNLALSLIENNKDYYVNSTMNSPLISSSIFTGLIVLYSYIKKLKAQIVGQNQYFSHQ